MLLGYNQESLTTPFVLVLAMQRHEKGGHTELAHASMALHRHFFRHIFGRRHVSNLRLASSSDSALYLLGDRTKKALIFHIEEESGLDFERLLGYPVMFTEALARVLGNGAYFVEMMLLKELRSAKSSSDAHRAMVEQLEISTGLGSTIASAGWGF